MEIRPITFKQACDFIIGLFDNDKMVGCAVCAERKGVKNEQTCYPTEKRERTDYIL